MRFTEAIQKKLRLNKSILWQMIWRIGTKPLPTFVSPDSYRQNLHLSEPYQILKFVFY